TLQNLISEYALDALHLTAGLLRVLAEAPESLHGLRHLLTGGDLVPAAAITAIKTACPELTVHHLYGPTEGTLCATTDTITPEQPTPHPLPLGTARTGTAVYLLDEHLRPVPDGVIGELYLAGTGLARGYHAQPARTAERFIPNPFTPGRLYRTGDLARHTAGQLHFHGRNDQQVKIRGHRIEPREIEHAILTHPHITQAHVTVHEPTPGNKQLTAYHVGHAPDLHHHLTTLLPDHMIPTTYTPLNQLPLPPHGKIDYKNLPTPNTAAPTAKRAPRTPRELELTHLFADILGRDPADLSIDDTFFELGGDSLLAIRLSSRARTALDAEIS